MPRLLHKPRKRATDSDLVMSILLDSDFIANKEEWDMMKSALYSALNWAKNVSKG